MTIWVIDHFSPCREWVRLCPYAVFAGGWSRRFLFPVGTFQSFCLDFPTNSVSKVLSYGLRWQSTQSKEILIRWMNWICQSWGYTSCEQEVRGAPQGTILGFLLSIVYINDLLSDIFTTIIAVRLNSKRNPKTAKAVLQKAVSASIRLIHVNETWVRETYCFSKTWRGSKIQA